MKLNRLLIASALTLAAATLSYAQGGRGSVPVPGGVNPNVPVGPGGTPVAGGAARPTHEAMGGPDTFITTRSFSGEIVEVDLDRGYVVVADRKRGSVKFAVGDKTRLKADKETPLGDKKKLTLEDFKEGQSVKVTFWPQNLQATEIKVRQPKS